MQEKMYLHPITKSRFINKTEYFKVLFSDEYLENLDPIFFKEANFNKNLTI
jgi:hypothetical protein